MEERRDRLQQWLDAREEYMAVGRNHLLGVSLPGMQLAITSHNQFVAGPRLTVVFHGRDVIDNIEDDQFDQNIFIEPVLGPPVDPFAISVPPVHFPSGYPSTGSAPTRGRR